uniref:uncharacterized protein LOC122609159 n=1 Tax=Erigeron canadensis TaxID=72917 RepID=UPI001CB88BA7|nr:uncharacterized protein LOC122609159 [Erigeron canadensis]
MGASTSSGAMNLSFTYLLNSSLFNEQFQQFMLMQQFNQFQATNPQFHNPLLPQFQRPIGETSSQPARTSVASVEEEVEEVPAPPKRLTKKGVAVADKLKWSNQEAILLAQAWTNASQDSIVGISQDETMFWAKVIEEFNENRPAGERNKSQLQGKWNKIKRTTKLYGAILKRLVDQGRQSECPAFWQDHSIAKRNAADFVDLGEDEGHIRASPSVEPDVALNQLFEDDPIRRPPGRNVSRKMSSGTDATYSRGGSTGSEKALNTLDLMLMLQEEQAKKIEEDRRRIEEERKMRMDDRFRKKVRAVFKLLQQPIPTGIDEDELQQVRTTRKNLMDKYGPYFNDM